MSRPISADLTASVVSVIMSFRLRTAAVVSTLLVVVSTVTLSLHASQAAEGGPLITSLSVSPSPGRGIPVTRSEPGGLVTLTHTYLPILITAAYRVNSGDIKGLPSWTANESFDIGVHAAVEDDEQLRGSRLFRVLQGVLDSAFKLRTHTEERTDTTYLLSRPRDDAALGPGLQPQAGPCDARVCGHTHMRPGHVQGEAVSLAQVATALSTLLGRRVVDHTGLSGTFHVALHGDSARSAVTPPSEHRTRLSLFTAVREQWGLTLTAATDRHEVLVIDHVEQPND